MSRHTLTLVDMHSGPGCDASRCNGVDNTLPCIGDNTLPCLTGVVVGGRECPLRPQRLSFLLSFARTVYSSLIVSLVLCTLFRWPRG